MCRNYCDIQQKHSEITTLYTFHSILIVLLQLLQHCCYNHCFCYYVSSNFYYNNYWCCNNHRLYMKIKCNFLVCKEKPMRKYLKHAFFPMASRGRLFGCKNKSLYRILCKNDATFKLIYYTFKWFPDESIISICSLKSYSLQHNVHFVTDGPTQSKAHDEAVHATIWACGVSFSVRSQNIMTASL